MHGNTSDTGDTDRMSFDRARIEETTEKLRRMATTGNTVAQTYYNMLAATVSDADKLRIVDQINSFVVSFRPPWERGPEETK